MSATFEALADCGYDAFRRQRDVGQKLGPGTVRDELVGQAEADDSRRGLDLILAEGSDVRSETSCPHPLFNRGK